MKTLYILRHAKSSWDNPLLADFERPLNKRGLDAAPFMGEIIYKNRFKPELLLSSPAKRAKQTAVLVREVGAIEPEIRFDERIYEASPQTLVQIISELGEQADSLLLVGHNPGLEGLIRFLTGETHPMPTATLAVIDLNIENWADVAAECGTLKNLIRPTDEK
jgi:phosphohistidine phosphatase